MEHGVKRMLQVIGLMLAISVGFMVVGGVFITLEPIIKVLEPLLLVALGAGVGIGVYVLYHRKPNA